MYKLYSPIRAGDVHYYSFLVFFFNVNTTWSGGQVSNSLGTGVAHDLLTHWTDFVELRLSTVLVFSYFAWHRHNSDVGNGA